MSSLFPPWRLWNVDPNREKIPRPRPFFVSQTSDPRRQTFPQAPRAVVSWRMATPLHRRTFRKTPPFFWWKTRVSRKKHMVTWVWVNTYRYIFSGMNIHKSQLFWGSLGTRVLTHPHMLNAQKQQIWGFWMVNSTVVKPKHAETT